MSGIKIVFGAAWGLWTNDETGPKLLDILREEDIKEIDTARGYGDSEKKIGERGVAQEFIIGTKFSGVFAKQPATREGIFKSATTSFDFLKTDKVQNS